MSIPVTFVSSTLDYAGQFFSGFTGILAYIVGAVLLGFALMLVINSFHH